MPDKDNYARWARRYIRSPGSSFSVKNTENLRGKLLDALIGSDTPAARFMHNVVTATILWVNITAIPARRFPYVTDVELFLEYVVKTINPYLKS